MTTEHPYTCGCSYCSPRKEATVTRIPAIPFEPWHEDKVQIARLLRWLILMDETPRDIPAFIEHADTWNLQHAMMEAAVDNQLDREAS